MAAVRRSAGNPIAVPSPQRCDLCPSKPWGGPSTRRAMIVYIAYRFGASMLLSPLLLERYGESGQHLRSGVADGRMTQRMKTIKTGRRVLLLAGSIGPLGHLPASGTVTVALVGVPLYALMCELPPSAYLAITTVFALLAVIVHHLGDAILGEKDSRRLVWDELAGFMIAVAGLPFTAQLAVTALLVERFFDIVKVPPARWIEDHVPGGWGVVGDDVIAGLYACGILHLLAHLAPSRAGLAR